MSRHLKCRFVTLKFRVMLSKRMTTFLSLGLFTWLSTLSSTYWKPKLKLRFLGYIQLSPFNLHFFSWLLKANKAKLILIIKRYLDEAEYAGVLRHSHIIRRVKLEFFLILRDVIALTLVPSALYATFSAAFSASSERTLKHVDVERRPLCSSPIEVCN